MKVTKFESNRSRNARALSAWENEGGAVASGHRNHHYGRRIEANKSWTVYHVFSGVPANFGSGSMVDLSEKEATTMMISLNANNAERRRAIKLKQAPLVAPQF
ncbi:hypothetical protein [Phyllobacterium zundukense]|uniref:Uncharacterized protein n=1 Tax=Phyllobacterium zundukense TaxID=1867719 RepID=A0A2N9VU95_9HYPH|nr:hypothetical protein [Phyllobacterium zundukense]ATU92992.1 hypothetical protein BLM14_16270 [Phyllobacterium zundukense]PIO43063.1 hypothetical protein B5P45_21825 [Phyllobacterium zundukense]